MYSCLLVAGKVSKLCELRTESDPPGTLTPALRFAHPLVGPVGVGVGLGTGVGVGIGVGEGDGPGVGVGVGVGFGAGVGVGVGEGEGPGVGVGVGVAGPDDCAALAPPMMPQPTANHATDNPRTRIAAFAHKDSKSVRLNIITPRKVSGTSLLFEHKAIRIHV